MTVGFRTASTGMYWAQKAMNVTANNIANLSTDGFKADSPSFADLLYTNVKEQEVAPELKVGHGSKLGKTDTIFGTSGMTETDLPQDYALTDQRNFFAVKTSDGQTVYTRDGRFGLSQRGDGRFYLADSSGNLVLSSNGRTIPVTDSKAKQNVGVFTFRNLDGLIKNGDSCYVSTNRSGSAVTVQNADICQECLESSGTDFATEMSNVILQERAYDLDAKMAVMTDEVMQTVNSLR